MQVMNDMEGRGRGWPKIRRVMQSFNGLEPELEEDREPLGESHPAPLGEREDGGMKMGARPKNSTSPRSFAKRS